MSGLEVSQLLPVSSSNPTANIGIPGTIVGQVHTTSPDTVENQDSLADSVCHYTDCRCRSCSHLRVPRRIGAAPTCKEEASCTQSPRPGSTGMGRGTTSDVSHSGRATNRSAVQAGPERVGRFRTHRRWYVSEVRTLYTR
jgi:hypothetical protein